MLEGGRTKPDVRLIRVEGTLKLLVALCFVTVGNFAPLLAELIFPP